jgi:CRP-like cAMP-binding protein
MMTTESLRDEEVLFEANDFSESVYVVAEGKLNVLLPPDPRPVRVLEPGDLLGEYGMFSNQARSATVQAAGEAVLLSLDYRRFRTFLLRFPETTLVLLKTTIERLLAAESRNREVVP